MSETMSVDTHDTSTNDAGDDPLQELSDDQLFQLVDDTCRANEVLATETQMFEKFHKRVEPKDLAGIGVAGAGVTPSQSSQVLTHGVSRKKSKSRSSAVDKSLRLNAEQKCDIAQREIEELREEIDHLKDDSEKVLDTYKAIMEEADLRLTETKKEAYEFDRDIMKGAVNQRTNKVVAEKVVRYFEDKLRSRDTLIEKLRLKNSTLKVQKKKVHLQLKQKEEMGEVLHEVDFNQLKIENQQYLEKIDERNQDLLRLKMMHTSTQQVLNTFKKKLHTITMESERLKSEITSRNDLLSRIDSETEVVELERAKAEKINRRLRQQLADFRVPDVMEYVSEKADLYELQKKVKSWERKVEIADWRFRGGNSVLKNNAPDAIDFQPQGVWGTSHHFTPNSINPAYEAWQLVHRHATNTILYKIFKRLNEMQTQAAQRIQRDGTKNPQKDLATDED